MAELTLPFRQGRDYVQGAELCEAMLDALGPRAELADMTFSIHEMVRAHHLEMLALGDEARRLAEFPVRLRLNREGDIGYWALRPIPGCGGAEGLEDHEEAIRAAAVREEETMRFEGASPLPALATAVSLKKNLMRALYPDRAGKWIFCRLDAPVPPPADCGRIEVRFRQTLRNIFLSEVRFGDAPAARMQFMVT